MLGSYFQQGGFLTVTINLEGSPFRITCNSSPNLYVRASCLRFSGIEPPQAEAKSNSQSKNTNTDLGVMAPKEGLDNLPNGGKEILSINFMNLKSSQVTNQGPLPEENTGLKPVPMTKAQEKNN
ncbi:hypothetical protein DSO57_1024153 [Entomophthora muscae]|uniref:Uncharacterized protein n=1 Tax=Entomophthora muscae TaxID=34485 RepID=A0ACC2UPA5_9FUNG|nr:hypothetical protein DSO57_1024153 [Entomophthora muscae]